ncbi:uncharacterized protein TNCV_3687251 [Trichonephila clavipes]|nr:uncharacterized protein TNCV_3687251 [Trichonephila clavipes]
MWTLILRASGAEKILPRGQNRNETHPKLKVFCAISQWKVYELFVFGKPTVTGSAYLDALQLWLFLQLKESEPDNFIWQQDGAPPHKQLVEHYCT